MSLLRWSQSNSNSKYSSTNGKNGSKNWIHPPKALQEGHVAYLVRFMGSTPVSEAKGIEVVKEAIRKVKFTDQLRRAEGAKPQKVEITISINGVAIYDYKKNENLHQYPLHRISYCADDKTDKRFFSFIAKEAEGQQHTCFVFISEKLAEQITLTIGQAFDLAYRRFLEQNGRDLETRKQLALLQNKVKILEEENAALKARLANYESSLSSTSSTAPPKITSMPSDRQKSMSLSSNSSMNSQSSEPSSQVNGTTLSSSSTSSHNAGPPPPLQPPPSAPPRSLNKSFQQDPSVNLLDIDISPPPASSTNNPAPVVGRKLENLTLDDLEDFDPRAGDNPKQVNGSKNAAPAQSNGQANYKQPPKEISSNSNGSRNKDLFGFEPFSQIPSSANQQPSSDDDPFGMGGFAATELESTIGDIDKKIAEMKEMRDGFTRGLSFGNDDFSVETLDPLNH